LIHPVQRLFSHQLIEEFMLTANKTVALYLDKCGQGMYRVHEEPDEEKIQHFINMANIVGYKLKSFPDSVALQSFLDQLKGKPESYLLNTLLLRSMKQAYYHHENMGHFGLSFSHYTHFTSPIRRYPDLVVHRLIKKFKKMDRSIKEAANPKFLKEASEKSSATERVAVEMERAMQKRKAIHYLRDHVGKAFYGVVSGVIESGIFVALNDLGIEGMVVNTLLEGYEYNEDFREFKKEKTVIGTGTQVKIRLISLNLKRELIDFQLLDVISQKGSA
jgi:ribonuclease R